uniref:Uncharacterized protein n=1 Tax=Amphimedon queenslandica TaxID=400682 RepID=A0A1X7TM77_AMPQE
VFLAEVLYSRVVADSHGRSSPFIEFGSRHVWLNEIKPFENTDGEYSEDNVLYTSPKSQSNLMDLIELQSLLCSDHMSKEVAVCINSLLTGDSDPTTTDMTTIDTVNNSDARNAISLSLYLLVWPHLDKLAE